MTYTLVDLYESIYGILNNLGLAWLAWKTHAFSASINGVCCKLRPCVCRKFSTFQLFRKSKVGIFWQLKIVWKLYLLSRYKISLKCTGIFENWRFMSKSTVIFKIFDICWKFWYIFRYFRHILSIKWPKFDQICQKWL